MLTYKNLVKLEELTPEKLQLLQYLAWCIEMVRLSDLFLLLFVLAIKKSSYLKYINL